MLERLIMRLQVGLINWINNLVRKENMFNRWKSSAEIILKNYNKINEKWDEKRNILIDFSVNYTQRKEFAC